MEETILEMVTPEEVELGQDQLFLNLETRQVEQVVLKKLEMKQLRRL